MRTDHDEDQQQRDHPAPLSPVPGGGKGACRPRDQGPGMALGGDTAVAAEARAHATDRRLPTHTGAAMWRLDGRNRYTIIPTASSPAL